MALNQTPYPNVEKETGIFIRLVAKASGELLAGGCYGLGRREQEAKEMGGAGSLWAWVCLSIIPVIVLKSVI